MTLIEKGKVPSGSTGLRDFTLEEMQTIIVSKAILSHDPKERSDFMVMILFAHMDAPAFWRPGDALWTAIEGPKFVIMDDIIYFKENFYVLSALNVLHVVDFNPKPKLIEVGPQIRIEGWPWQRYLVDFNGSLLLIARFCQLVENKLSMTSVLNMIEVNLEENCLCERYDIGNYALFLGRNSSIFVSSSHFLMCKKNSIYFTNLIESCCPSEFGCRDVGIFDMTDRTINTFYPVVFPPCVGSSIWLVPNPW